MLIISVVMSFVRLMVFFVCGYTYMQCEHTFIMLCIVVLLCGYTHIEWGVLGEELGGVGQELFAGFIGGEVVHLLPVLGRYLRVSGVQHKVLLEGNRAEVVGVSQGLLLVPVGIFLLK